MDPRYQHPQITELWSLPWTYDAWFRIERAALDAQVSNDIIPEDAKWETDAILREFNRPDFAEKHILAGIAAIESRIKHDVMAFVSYLREWYGEPHGRWIHFGLTSSDLVDTAQAMRFKAVSKTLAPMLDQLKAAVMEHMHDRTPILGRTHGEPAEPISVEVRASHWWELIYHAGAELRDTTAYAMDRIKLSGPTGSFAHNPPEIELDVASELGLDAQGPGASQIVPRVHLAQWASDAARLVAACAKIAMDIRLMLLLGEATEIRPVGQVGSSSMAHKTNPIRAEKITGLQRVAAGYASMLQPLDLWLERDISNSSVERIAVPGLWHVTLHVIEETTALLRSLRIGHGAMAALMRAAGQPFVHAVTLDAIRHGQDATTARIEATTTAGFKYKEMTSPIGEVKEKDPYGWFVRNYPHIGGDDDDRP